MVVPALYAGTTTLKNGVEGEEAVQSSRAFILPPKPASGFPVQNCRPAAANLSAVRCEKKKALSSEENRAG
jgi:hypothetical protein